jgi:hypothetical protein
MRRHPPPPVLAGPRARVRRAPGGRTRTRPRRRRRTVCRGSWGRRISGRNGPWSSSVHPRLLPRPGDRPEDRAVHRRSSVAPLIASDRPIRLVIIPHGITPALHLSSAWQGRAPPSHSPSPR